MYAHVYVWVEMYFSWEGTREKEGSGSAVFLYFYTYYFYNNKIII